VHVSPDHTTSGAPVSLIRLSSDTARFSSSP
jgi:hypothetical protein